MADRLTRRPPSPQEAATLVRDLARAVQFAHQRGVVQRDLKRANILLTADGAPKITDFTLAKQLDAGAGQTATGAILGTPSYMAPEQAGGRSHEIGPAADMHADRRPWATVGVGAGCIVLQTLQPPRAFAERFATLPWLVFDSATIPIRNTTRHNVCGFIETAFASTKSEPEGSGAQRRNGLNCIHRIAYNNLCIPAGESRCDVAPSRRSRS